MAPVRRGPIGPVVRADSKTVSRHCSGSKTQRVHYRSSIVSSVSASGKGFKIELDKLCRSPIWHSVTAMLLLGLERRLWALNRVAQAQEIFGVKPARVEVEDESTGEVRSMRPSARRWMGRRRGRRRKAALASRCSRSAPIPRWSIVTGVTGDKTVWSITCVGTVVALNGRR